MNRYKRRSYQPPCVTGRGYSVRVDTQDFPDVARAWQFPLLIQTVSNTAMNWGIFFLLLAFVGCVHDKVYNTPTPSTTSRSAPVIQDKAEQLRAIEALEQYTETR